MTHTINHRFTMTFKMLTVCDLCLKQMFIGKSYLYRNLISMRDQHFFFLGLKCKDCKYKCHRDCATKVPPSCKLPPGFIDYVRQCISDGKKKWLLADSFVKIMFQKQKLILRSPNTNPAANRWNK